MGRGSMGPREQVAPTRIKLSAPLGWKIALVEWNLRALRKAAGDANISDVGGVRESEHRKGGSHGDCYYFIVASFGAWASQQDENPNYNMDFKVRI